MEENVMKQTSIKQIADELRAKGELDQGDEGKWKIFEHQEEKRNKYSNYAWIIPGMIVCIFFLSTNITFNAVVVYVSGLVFAIFAIWAFKNENKLRIKKYYFYNCGKYTKAKITKASSVRFSRSYGFCSLIEYSYDVNDTKINYTGVFVLENRESKGALYKPNIPDTLSVNMEIDIILSPEDSTLSIIYNKEESKSYNLSYKSRL